MSEHRYSEFERQFISGYYDDPGTWRETYWLGVPVRKCPLDLWIFQEIMAETSPDLIVESGTFKGGSALFMASVCDELERGEVLTIDLVEETERPRHPRITYLLGSSTDPEVVRRVEQRAGSSERVMVVLDSDHSEAHVFEELRLLGPLVTPGCYLIVEDTIVNGNPILSDFGPGPAEAVSRFLAQSPGWFETDLSREKFHMTFNPGGFLRRVA